MTDIEKEFYTTAYTKVLKLHVWSNAICKKHCDSRPDHDFSINYISTINLCEFETIATIFVKPEMNLKQVAEYFQASLKDKGIKVSIKFDTT